MSEESIYKAEEARKLQTRGSSLPAVGLIGTGLFLLAATLFDFDLMNVLWPGFVVTPGLILLWPAFHSTAERQSKISFLAVPGAFITTTGVLLFVMNLTNHFEAWAYSWTLTFAAAVAGLMYMKRFDLTSRVHVWGHQFIRAMLIAFIGFAVLFEILIFDNFNPLLPLAIIGYGVYMLAKGRRQTTTL